MYSIWQVRLCVRSGVFFKDYDAQHKSMLLAHIKFFMCRSLHMVAEASQRRVCPMPAKENYIVVPYASSHVRMSLYQVD